nr:2OG-Fe(II) oxygenase superfamily [Oceanusvirus sp.]
MQHHQTREFPWVTAADCGWLSNDDPLDPETRKAIERKAETAEHHAKRSFAAARKGDAELSAGEWKRAAKLVNSILDTLSRDGTLDASVLAMFRKYFSIEANDQRIEFMHAANGKRKGTENEDLVEHGMCEIPITEEEVESVRTTIAEEIASLTAKDPTPIVIKKRGSNYDRSSSFSSFTHPELYAALQKIFNRRGVFSATKAAFSAAEAFLSNVTLHVSKEDDKHYLTTCRDLVEERGAPATSNMHFDPKNEVLKVIFYLKDVSGVDGPFCYSKGSHRWNADFDEHPFRRPAAKANGVVNYMQDELRRRTFLALPSNMRYTSVFGNLVDDGSDLSRDLLESETPITSDRCRMILFNPGGVHRGGITQRGGLRQSLQIVISTKH